MSLYAIGDLHLCLGAYKPMDVFGGRWEGYMDKLREGLSVIQPGDTTVLLGDLSWALGIEQAEKDFAFIHEFPAGRLSSRGTTTTGGRRRRSSINSAPRMAGTICSS